MATDRDLLAEAQEQFRLSSEADDENRREAIDDLRFARLADQWPPAIRKAREAEGRPCLTINRLPAFIRQVVNECRQNKPAIRVRPASSEASVETAQVYDGLIRHIEQMSDAEIAYDTAVESAVTCGFGYFRIRADYAHDDTFDLDLMIERVANPLSVRRDHRSTAADASDWNYGFVTEWLSNDEFDRLYKGAARSDWNGADERLRQWFDVDATQVAEWWRREEAMRRIVLLSTGEVIDARQFMANKALFDAEGIVVSGEREARSWRVTQRIVSGLEVLETNEWAGRSIPIIPVYGDEVNEEGKRHFRSLIRDAKDPQKMFNFWRTSSTELVALSPLTPFIGRRGAFDSDAGKWQTANTKSHAFIEYDGDAPPPQRQPFAGVPAGAIQEALNAADDMKAITGIYDAALGARSNETSGVAIRRRQLESDTSTFHFIDNLSRAIRYGGRVLIDLIPAVYAKPRTLRILGEDGDARNVRVNDPSGAQPDGSTAHYYDLTAGKYDLVVDAGPGYTTKREEASTMLMEMSRANPQVAGLVVDLIAKNQDWPEADRIARRFHAMLPPQIQQLEAQGDDGKPDVAVLTTQLAQLQQANQQMQQQMQQLAVAADKERARVQVDQQKIAADREAQQAEQRIKQAELQLDAERLVIERSKARAEIAAQRRAATGAASVMVDASGQPIALPAPADDGGVLLEDESQRIEQGIDQLGQAIAGIARLQAQLLAEARRRKTVLRDANGRIIGVQ